MRLRRTRNNPNIRTLLQENVLNIKDFIYPLFVTEKDNFKKEISSMPDVYQMSIEHILKECQELKDLGIYSIILFGIPNHKDATGSSALREDSIVPKCIRAIKEKHKDMLVIADLCFCEYTDHGHCGILDTKTQSVDNDATLEILGIQALELAKSGVDMIAPSTMMDNMISHLRSTLDNAGFYNLPIMSYSTKFASGYYGPFREVAESTPSFGDRRGYQQDPSNRREAILESIIDQNQGADILMVKPALAYLDVVRDIRERTLLPLAVYNVSGEYSMLKLAKEVIDYERVMLENMISFKRAGADIIISYHTKEVAKILKNKI